MSGPSGGSNDAALAGNGLTCTLPESTSLRRDVTLLAIFPSCVTLGNASFKLSEMVVMIWPMRTKVTVPKGAAPEDWEP